MLPVELHRPILQYIKHDNEVLHLLTVSRVWRAEVERRIYSVIDVEACNAHDRRLQVLSTLGKNKRLALLVRTLRIDLSVHVSNRSAVFPLGRTSKYYSQELLIIDSVAFRQNGLFRKRMTAITQKYVAV